MIEIERNETEREREMAKEITETERNETGREKDMK